MQLLGKFSKIICWRPPGLLTSLPRGNPGSATEDQVLWPNMWTCGSSGGSRIFQRERQHQRGWGTNPLFGYSTKISWELHGNSSASKIPRGHQPRGTNLLFGIIFGKNCMKIRKKIDWEREHTLFMPHRSANRKEEKLARRRGNLSNVDQTLGIYCTS